MDNLEIKNNENLIEKNCNNCNYYLQHYIVNKYAVRETNFGHCRKNIKINPSPCKSWTERQDDTAKKELSLKQTIEKMSAQLKSISLAINKKD